MNLLGENVYIQSYAPGAWLVKKNNITSCFVNFCVCFQCSSTSEWDNYVKRKHNVFFNRLPGQLLQANNCFVAGKL